MALNIALHVCYMLGRRKIKTFSDSPFSQTLNHNYNKLFVNDVSYSNILAEMVQVPNNYILQIIINYTTKVFQD